MKSFDTIDIFFIIVISIYFVALFLFVSIFIIKFIETDKDGNINEELLIEREKRKEKLEKKRLSKKINKQQKKDEKKVNKSNKKDLNKSSKNIKEEKGNKKVTKKVVIIDAPAGKQNTSKRNTTTKARANKTKKKTPKKSYRNNMSYVKNNPKKVK